MSKQVSEAGGAAGDPNDLEAQAGGADAVPDKSTGSATGDEEANLDE
ncbi:hypothetical protein [Nocardioides mangrovicus]|nr:hypothetical protein [Nocardioides mangrovicus]